jgi:hypothetical protein
LVVFEFSAAKFANLHIYSISCSALLDKPPRY